MRRLLQQSEDVSSEGGSSPSSVSSHIPYSANRPQLLVAHGVSLVTQRRLHCKKRDDLQEMVLHDIPDRTDLFVESSASFPR